MPEILSHIEDKICVLRIANEAKRNAITHAMARKLLRELKAAETDPAVRVVIVAGQGEMAFSSGHDLTEPMFDETGDGDLAFGYPYEMQTPVIAAISGHCHAAGLMLALACDIRVSDSLSTFGSPGVKMGMLPMGGQIFGLARVMTPGRAKRFLMSAMFLNGRQAYDWGLVDELAGDGAVLETALDLARVIAANSPASVAGIKAGIRLMDGDTRVSEAAWERKHAVALIDSPDAREGLAAHWEKRAPQFEDLLPERAIE